MRETLQRPPIQAMPIADTLVLEEPALWATLPRGLSPSDAHGGGDGDLEPAASELSPVAVAATAEQRPLARSPG